MENLNNYDWYCDECNALLNSQPGFYAECGMWTCTECGYSNSIHEAEILDADELENFESSGYNSYNEYVEEMGSGERLSVDEAALIWASHGKDEDYTFGYSEEELEDAL